jgi:hypothetical protein
MPTMCPQQVSQVDGIIFSWSSKKTAKVFFPWVRYALQREKVLTGERSLINCIQPIQNTVPKQGGADRRNAAQTFVAPTSSTLYKPGKDAI